jgi:hypothetical protein
MSDGAVGWRSEEQKSLRELSTSLASFEESQAQIKCIFTLYDHDSDGICTTNQGIMLMRKLGYVMPSAWAYVYRDAITLPLVRCAAVVTLAYFCLFLSHLNQVLQFVLGKLFEKQKEMKTSKAFLRSIDQFCIMNADPKGLILESELVPFLTKMGINVRRQHCCSPSACRHCCTLNICLYRSKHLPLSL